MAENRLKLILGLAIVWAPVWSPVWSSGARAALASKPTYVGMPDSYAKVPEVRVQAAIATPDDWLEQGQRHLEAGRWQAAVQSLDKAEQGFLQRGDRQRLALTFLLQGNVYQKLENYARALDRYQNARPGLADQPLLLAELLLNQGNVYKVMGQLAQALQFYEQAQTAISQQPDRSFLAAVLVNKGALFRELGDKQRALATYQQARAILDQSGERRYLASLLLNLGNLQNELGNPRIALGHYERARTLFEALNDRASLKKVLLNQGKIYGDLGQHSQAIAAYQQAEPLLATVGTARQRGLLLLNRGFSRRSLGQNEAALRDYQQALALVQGDRSNEGYVLSNLGELFESQGQKDLAILFYKQSVKRRETIRQPLGELDPTLEQTYVRSVADTYRALADLLLSQGRIAEAQQTLDLLKLEELREFTNTRATWTGRELQYTDLEQPVIDAHTDLIAFGQTLYSCEQNDCAEQDKLQQEYEQLITAYQAEVKAFEETVWQNRSGDRIFQDPKYLSEDARDLLQASPNAVLLYPFVTEDKLWLLYATPGSVGSIGLNVSQAQLATTVQQFGSQLQSSSDLTQLQATGQQLYDWIIRPLEAALEKNGIEHLIFVNDRVTRYIPMATLFDGQQYLLEKYTLSSVLSPELTNTTDRLGPPDRSSVLGLGLSQSVPGFSPLPAVETELEQIVRRSDIPDSIGVYPGQVHLNNDFTLERLKDSIKDHRILHIATHAEFVPGRPDESYLVLGNGDRLSIPDIDQMERRLDNLHLVVLSACQTALGGTAGDGTEIAGLSAYFLRKRRAEAVIASLWSVNDSSTSLLMQRFYQLLASGELTKAEAMRQAQLSLLYDEGAEERLAASRASVVVEASQSRAATGRADSRHPFHWAPFILIGNGL